MQPDCPFCTLRQNQIFYSTELVVGIWDAHPVSNGHALLLPRRHVSGWFDASLEEQQALLRGLHEARAVVAQRHNPDGYNIGVNIGRAAGQTIFHLHVHLIPRYDGDHPDPRGGVRAVIDGQANYLTNGTRQRLVTGGLDDPFLPHLLAELDNADHVDIAAAFTLESGVTLIEEHLRDVLSRGGRVRIVTGDYLGVTEPSALLRLLDLQGVELRVFRSAGISFHPKAYILARHGSLGAAFVGSSNLSETALRKGVEWNYNVQRERDHRGFAEIRAAFDRLWTHSQVQPVDVSWIEEYERRRLPPLERIAGIEQDIARPLPQPHSIQIEALAALRETRAAGNSAGLVVLATGLGKTWLSAFDSMGNDFKRALFVAHREEILTQALRTFRTIRPMAVLGLYNGQDKHPNADILFASIQTLGRERHLHRFDPKQFDYIVVDEFHHAAASSYRRVIDYFEPRFLLGLTATPERTDGGDLLALCGDNLVYRCDLPEGIRRGLLAPFAYHGVPDDVDYANIPWRNNRFDETELTNQLATHTRAENAFQQFKRLGKTRTLGFCVSQRHAEYTASFFVDKGVRAVAVHAGPSSAPRAHSLERLEAGELDIVFAVDMFNEGVDLPDVDTVLMLRPTESRILWLQQFGRGLRFRPGKQLQVIDYIGNHRIFLTKTRALLDLGNTDRDVAFALDKLEEGTFSLPPGCSVTYELEAKEILRSLLRIGGQEDALRKYYVEFRELHGIRPTALETYEDGLDPRSARRDGFKSWFDLVQAMGDLSAGEAQVRSRIGHFLEQLEVTQMTRSYKMLVLLAIVAEETFPGPTSIAALTDRFARLARRYASIRSEIGDALDDPNALQRLIETNPIAAWTGGAGTGDVSYFSYSNGEFVPTFTLPPEAYDAARAMVRELAEWRLTAYLRRSTADRGADRIVCKVAHSGGRPILFLPARESFAGIPEGWVEILAEDEELQARFVKIAVNVVTRPGSTDNMLPAILRQWFGPEAGAPGRTDRVVFERVGSTYRLAPFAGDDHDSGPKLWQTYHRKEAVAALNIVLSGWDAQSGIVRRPGGLVFFVTLDKSDLAQEYQYGDRFWAPDRFEWQSQNRTTQSSELGQDIRLHRERGIDVHLFVRRSKKQRGHATAFYYCGTLEFQEWKGERPITVWWRLNQPVPSALWRELNVPPASV